SVRGWCNAGTCNGRDSDQPCLSCSSDSTSCALRPPVQPIAKHQDADCNQNERPHSRKTPKRKPIEIVQQQQSANANQDNRPDGPFPAPGFQWIECDSSCSPSLSGAHRVKSHVKHEARDQERQRNCRTRV